MQLDFKIVYLHDHRVLAVLKYLKVGVLFVNVHEEAQESDVPIGYDLNVGCPPTQIYTVKF